jgi:hypothetical protein
MQLPAHVAYNVILLFTGGQYLAYTRQHNPQSVEGIMLNIRMLEGCLSTVCLRATSTCELHYDVVSLST